MDQAQVIGLPPCVYAVLDAETSPSQGVTKVTKNESVLLFSGEGGYEALVRQRLKDFGKDPDAFSIGDLPWGERVADSPLIVNRGKFYLQTITIHQGVSEYFIKGTDRKLSASLFEKKASIVPVKAYAIENIKRLVIEGS